MVLICPKCEARLQLDETKAPSRPFTVRCPKCQTPVNVQASVASIEMSPSETAQSSALLDVPARATFERPASAPPFNGEGDAPVPAAPASAAGLSDLAKLMAEALRQADGGLPIGRGKKRPAWDRRKALVCATPAHRQTIARSLVSDYEVFVAENTPQALGRMREERMDIVILDANFDPVEQGVAFVTREIKLLRPAERRRLFFVYLASGMRTMDSHAAFLHDVNLVVSPSDIDQLPEVLEISIRHYNELYRDFIRALDVTPI